MISTELIQRVREAAIEETNRTGYPTLINFELSEAVGVEFSKKIGGDLTVVKLGVYLMDYKLGEAIEKGVLKEHVRMSADAANDLLSRLGVESELKERILDCILSHHGKDKYDSIEAEIVANADCYRFIHPRGLLNSMLSNSRKEGESFEGLLNHAEVKMDEKYSVLSLAAAKEELEPYYQTFKKYLNVARSK